MRLHSMICQPISSASMTTLFITEVTQGKNVEARQHNYILEVALISEYRNWNPHSFILQWFDLIILTILLMVHLLLFF